MSRFAARIKRLERKTRFFMSHRHLCLIRDYAQAKFERIEKSPDMEEKVLELRDLLDRIMVSNDPVIRQRMMELMKSSETARLKLLIPIFIQWCDEYPNGNFFPNFWLPLQEELTQAKIYFARQKQEEEARAREAERKREKEAREAEQKPEEDARKGTPASSRPDALAASQQTARGSGAPPAAGALLPEPVQKPEKETGAGEAPLRYLRVFPPPDVDMG